jgi:hypothetical protein
MAAAPARRRSLLALASGAHKNKKDIGNSTKELTLPSLSDTVSAFGLAVSLPSQQPSIVPGRRARRLVIVEQLF